MKTLSIVRVFILWQRRPGPQDIADPVVPFLIKRLAFDQLCSKIGEISDTESFTQISPL
jgi:hypothetical protein